MYDYTDKVILYMKKRFIRLFNQFKSRVSFDELNVLQSARSLYEEMEKIVEESFLLIAKRAYADNGGEFTDTITALWLLELLEEYDPVTKYVYLHEVERKCSRFAESVIASTNKAQEINTALRYWSNMVSQYAIEVTDRAALQAYIDRGAEKAIWVTIKDEKRCKECRARDGKIYDIAKIPPKPHIGCRCFLLPYFGGANDE